MVLNKKVRVNSLSPNCILDAPENLTGISKDKCCETTRLMFQHLHNKNTLVPQTLPVQCHECHLVNVD